jgi:hypothetical protein
VSGCLSNAMSVQRQGLSREGPPLHARGNCSRQPLRSGVRSLRDALRETTDALQYQLVRLRMERSLGGLCSAVFIF